MNTQPLFQPFIGNDYSEISSSSFESIMALHLEKFGKVERQILVENRGDGKRGFVDMKLSIGSETFGIEIDRKTPRAKSISKLQVLGCDHSFLVTRSPFQVTEI